MIPVNEKQSTWLDRLTARVVESSLATIARFKQFESLTPADLEQARHLLTIRLRGEIYQGLEDFDVKIDTAAGMFEGTHWGVKHIAMSFGESLRDYGGEHYMEIEVFDPISMQPIVVTVRRKEGKTPGHAAAEALDMLTALVKLAATPADERTGADMEFLDKARELGRQRDELNAKRKPQVEKLERFNKSRWTVARRLVAAIRWAWNAGA